MIVVNILFGISVALALVKGLDWANKKASGSPASGGSVDGSTVAPVLSESVKSDPKSDAKPINAVVIDQKIGVAEAAIANKIVSGKELKFSNMMPVAPSKQKIM